MSFFVVIVFCCFVYIILVVVLIVQVVVVARRQRSRINKRRVDGAFPFMACTDLTGALLLCFGCILNALRLCIARVLLLARSGIANGIFVLLP